MFGLLPVDPGWVSREVEGAVMYFDGDRLCKVIARHRRSRAGYNELDYDLLTLAGRSLLAPTSARGKPKKLTLSSVFERKPAGFTFTSDYEAGSLLVRHPKNLHSVASV